ncbi:MAG: thiopurine S-methyltransferase [Myxococcota bacterium]
MKQAFWSERWEEGRIGFHQPTGNPLLPGHLSSFPMGRVLVPLAGKTIDIVTLHKAGYDVVAVEFVETAVRAFGQENPELNLQPHDGPLGFELRGERLRFLAADFFTVTHAEVGRFDFVYDRAALIALPPADQPRYVEHLRSLIAPEGHIMAVTLDYPQTTMKGPPFSTPPHVVESLYTDAEVAILNTEIPEPHPFAARGCGPLKEHLFRIAKASQ